MKERQKYRYSRKKEKKEKKDFEVANPVLHAGFGLDKQQECASRFDWDVWQSRTDQFLQVCCIEESTAIDNPSLLQETILCRSPELK